MPAWLHERAKHIQSKNPSMPEGEAFAIATQQSHALGKTPKSYGTVKGREVAKAKFKTPGDDVKTAGLMHALTTPIPGTPNLLPHVADSFVHAIGGLGSKPPPALASVKPKSLGDIYAARRALVKSSSATLHAFVDELEKIALSPQVEAAGATFGLLRKAQKAGKVDELKNTAAWKQLALHASNPTKEKGHNPIFAKLHDRLGTYIKQQGAST